MKLLKYFKNIRLSIALGIALLTPAFGIATPCVQLLTDAQIIELLNTDENARIAFWREVDSHGSINMRQSLKFLRTIEREHIIGPRHIYRLADPSRSYTEFGIENGNPEGSYLFPLLTLGPRLSRLFGIEFNPTLNEVTLPGAERIQFAIDQLNRHLSTRDQILWNFYDEPKKTEGRTYLTRFAQDFALPISQKLRGHDINYHLGIIAMPNPMAEILNLKVALQLRYLDQLIPAWERQNAQNPLREVGRRNLELLITECIRQRVQKIDVYSGNFTTALAGRLGPKSLEDWSFHYSVTSQQSMTASTQLYESIMYNGVYLSLPGIAPFRDWIRQNLHEFMTQNHTLENNTVVFIYGQELRDLVIERRVALEQAAIAVENE